MTYPLVLMVQTSPQARTPQSAPHIERRYCGNYIYSGTLPDIDRWKVFL